MQDNNARTDHRMKCSYLLHQIIKYLYVVNIDIDIYFDVMFGESILDILQLVSKSVALIL